MDDDDEFMGRNANFLRNECFRIDKNESKPFSFWLQKKKHFFFFAEELHLPLNGAVTRSHSGCMSQSKFKLKKLKIYFVRARARGDQLQRLSAPNRCTLIHDL